MTELEMSQTLGMIMDPVRNRLAVTSDLALEMTQLGMAFTQAIRQRPHLGTLNPDLWLEFVPWHSLN